ncbi:MAG: TolC family protein [Planctomycetaceae bacterium]
MFRSRLTQRQPARRHGPGTIRAVLALMLCVPTGCQRERLQRHYVGPERPAQYVDHATEIKHPVEVQPVSCEVCEADLPRTLRNAQHDQVWDLSLSEVIHLTLSNSRVIRSSATFLSPGNPLMSNPDSLPSVYDPALQDTGTLFGRRGVEAALSEFDAQFTTSMIWGHNETIQNNRFTSGGLDPGDTLVEETGAFSTGVRKRFATGAQFGVSHVWDYSKNNAAGRLFPSVYEGNLRAEFRQPLLAGAGTEYTRIAGPISENIQGVTGVNQGVLIARIDNDIALAEFELAVHLLLRDVETLYWELVGAYQSYHTQVTTRVELKELWDKVRTRLEGDAAGGGRLAEAEAHEAYLRAEAASIAALDQIYDTEARLRRLIGLSINDGRVIRPLDSPIAAEIVPDWHTSLGLALVLRPELRRQKWNVKSIDLQLTAAENLLQPRLDLVASAQTNGFGDNLAGGVNDGVTNNGLGSAYHRLLAGQQTGWNVGVEYSTPIGRRFAHTQVRNLELQLAKSREALHQQEIEVSHELAAAFRDVDRSWLALQNADEQIIAGCQRYEATRDRLLPDDVSINGLLQARESLAQAELRYVAALTEYNTALTNLHYRSGRVLEVNSVQLSEGNWTPAARQDAVDRHAARQHAHQAYLKGEDRPPLSQ